MPTVCVVLSRQSPSEPWCVCHWVQWLHGERHRGSVHVSCGCVTFACKTQVFSSDPRAVLMMQRLEAGGGDCGPGPGVRA